MVVGLLGRKVGMTQIYREDGQAVPVTVLECGPCTVLQIKTPETDGYSAVQLGYMDRKRKTATAAARGHARKAENAEPKRYIREIRQEEPPALKLGELINVSVFEEIKRVDVTGVSKGRGFAGVIKRHGFRGLRATHGVKRMHRHPGSSGPSADPSRTRKGIRKPGHFGHNKVTALNLEVVKVDPEANILLVKGAVPGPNGGFVTVRQTNRLG